MELPMIATLIFFGVMGLVFVVGWVWAALEAADYERLEKAHIAIRDYLAKHPGAE
jgi:outer membrane lipoprotein-sorting protein